LTSCGCTPASSSFLPTEAIQPSSPVCVRAMALIRAMALNYGRRDRSADRPRPTARAATPTTIMYQHRRNARPATHSAPSQSRIRPHNRACKRRRRGLPLRSYPEHRGGNYTRGAVGMGAAIDWLGTACLRRGSLASMADGAPQGLSPCPAALVAGAEHTPYPWHDVGAVFHPPRRPARRPPASSVSPSICPTTFVSSRPPACLTYRPLMDMRELERPSSRLTTS
jgi:hypothetical protein